MKQRRIEPEILDSLPPDHPAVLENRHDLLRLNRLMGTFSWMRCQLQRIAGTAARIVEIGAGDGALALHMGSHLSDLGLQWTAVDLCPQPPGWPTNWSWLRKDLMECDLYREADGVIGNLILHQFRDEDLRMLGRTWNDAARFLLFSEPLRCQRSLWLLRAGWVAGLGPIARYDGAVSIRAGFRGAELPTLLNLDPARWEWTVSTTFLGAYRMLARRRDN